MKVFNGILMVYAYYIVCVQCIDSNLVNFEGISWIKLLCYHVNYFYKNEMPGDF